MERNLEEVLKKRRSRYKLEKEIEVGEERIIELLRETVTHVPSAFNSQSTRLVLLLGESHNKFWQTVSDAIARITPPEVNEKSRKKIQASFASGYGTILFFEDGATIERMKKEFPLYADDFPIYSEHTSAMHQIILWLLLADADIGASLQHYGPLVEKEVKQHLSLPDEWRLIAQMPFGKATDTPPLKTCLPIEETLKIYH